MSDVIAAHPARRWDDGSENLECGCGWIVDYEQIDFGSGESTPDLTMQEERQHAAHVAASLREASLIRDAGEAEALPAGSVIRDAGGFVAVHNGIRGIYGVSWLLAGYPHTRTCCLDFPAHVLYRPEVVSDDCRVLYHPFEDGAQ